MRFFFGRLVDHWSGRHLVVLSLLRMLLVPIFLPRHVRSPLPPDVGQPIISPDWPFMVILCPDTWHDRPRVCRTQPEII